MGSRKDLIKRSLGITEYPWSSDDELEEARITTEDLNTPRPPAEPQPSDTDAPGPSGIGPAVQQVLQQQQLREQHQQHLRTQHQHMQAASRRQARQDRELFWSIIHSPHRITSTSQSSRARASEVRVPPRVSHVPAPELWPSVAGRRPNLQRINEFKRVMLNLSGRRQRNHAAGAGLIPRANPGVVVPSEANSSIIINRHLPIGRITRNPPLLRPPSRNGGRTTPPAVGGGWELPAAAAGEAGERVRASRSATEFGARDRTVLRATRGARSSPDGQPDLPRPLLVHNSEDEVNNNPSTSVAAEPEALVGGNDDLNRNVTLDDDLDVDAMENTGANVTLEEEIVAIDLDQPSDTSQVANEEGTSAPAAGQDQTDGRFTSDVRRHGVSGDANTSSNNANDNSEAWQDTEQRKEARKRRNSNDSAVPHTVKEFNQNLLRLLECPVCLEWMEPPMSQCRRGHLVCGVCRARLSSCPVCRTTFSSVRNRAMESVAELLRYPCRHGCGKEVRLRRRVPHEASCVARKYQCPAPLCAAASPMPLPNLAAHFQSHHLTMIKFGRQHKFSIKMNSEQHDNWLIMAMEQYFHLRIDVDIRTWGVVVYVSYIGPKCDAKNYTYEVSIDGQHNQRKLTYARTTHSDLESSSLNVCRQDCFHLTLDQALNFIRIKNRHCDGDKFLDISLQIAKVERQVEPLNDSDS